jgi:hypothetical protein
MLFLIEGDANAFNSIVERLVMTALLRSSESARSRGFLFGVSGLR